MELIVREPGEAVIEELRKAKVLLETTSLAARVTDALGKPIEQSLKLLPDSVLQTIQTVTQQSLDRALRVALGTLHKRQGTPASERAHKLAGFAAGAAGGMFGLAGLVLELPVTTIVMLRSVGDIARSEGHDLNDAQTRLDCLEVFALGGPSGKDDAVETGYYAVRTALSKMITDAARHLTEKGMTRGSAPVLVKLIEKIAARFGIVVQEKVALELVPLIGSVSGALINTAFMDHFQTVARGHFIIRRLEAIHGIERIRATYEKI